MGAARNLSRLTELRRTVGTRRALWITPLWSVAKRYVVIGRQLTDTSDLQVSASEYTCHGLESTSPVELASLDSRLDTGEIQRRISEGQTCEIWRRDGEIVHFRWYAKNRTALPFLGLEYVPAPGNCLVYEVFTSPDRRVRGIHSTVAAHSLRRSSGDGHQQVVAMCGWWNTPALRVGEKHGYERLGTVTRWQLGPWVTFSSTGKVEVSGTVLSIAGPRVGAR